MEKASKSSCGRFSHWEKCTAIRCRCKSDNVHCRKWTSALDDIYYQFRCQKCGYYWWLDD